MYHIWTKAQINILKTPSHSYLSFVQFSLYSEFCYTQWFLSCRPWKNCNSGQHWIKKWSDLLASSCIELCPQQIRNNIKVVTIWKRIKLVLRASSKGLFTGFSKFWDCSRYFIDKWDCSRDILDCRDDGKRIKLVLCAFSKGLFMGFSKF